MQTVQALLGITVMVCIANLLSHARKNIPWRSVIIGLVGQVIVGATFLHIDWAKRLLVAVTFFAKSLEVSTQKATAFVFGYIGSVEPPFDVVGNASTFIFAFQVLPVIMVIGALSALLWHWRILGTIVSAGSWIVQKSVGVSAPVGFASVANAFLGMIEAPLLIKPYLARMSPSELFTIMAVGMSTIAGGTAVIISSIVSVDPTAFANVVTATLMNVPGAIAFSLILFPPSRDGSDHVTQVSIESPYRSSMDALVSGTADGVKIFVNVVSLLIVFIALVALLDLMLDAAYTGLSLATIMGYLLAPITWLLGIAPDEALLAAEILGTKVAVNELVAYTYLASTFGVLSEESHFILTFALCGFGNFGSLAIMIGGISAMAPDRRDEIIRFGLWALLAAFLTNCVTAAIASIVV